HYGLILWSALVALRYKTIAVVQDAHEFHLPVGARDGSGLNCLGLSSGRGPSRDGEAFGVESQRSLHGQYFVPCGGLRRPVVAERYLLARHGCGVGEGLIRNRAAVQAA